MFSVDIDIDIPLHFFKYVPDQVIALRREESESDRASEKEGEREDLIKSLSKGNFLRLGDVKVQDFK